jgi:hypothetical protein
MMQSVEALPEAAELETSLGTVGNDVEEVPASFQHSSYIESLRVLPSPIASVPPSQNHCVSESLEVF